jgi:hypothetical protein
MAAMSRNEAALWEEKGTIAAETGRFRSAGEAWSSVVGDSLKDSRIKGYERAALFAYRRGFSKGRKQKNPSPGTRVTTTVKELKRIYQAGKRGSHLKLKVSRPATAKRKRKTNPTKRRVKRKTTRRAAPRKTKRKNAKRRNTPDKHYVLLRRKHGFGSGPGSGYQEQDTVQVMAASKTLAGAKRHQKRLGGWIEEADGPYRPYSHNEHYRYA